MARFYGNTASQVRQHALAEIASTEAMIAHIRQSERGTLEERLEAISGLEALIGEVRQRYDNPWDWTC